MPRASARALAGRGRHVAVAGARGPRVACAPACAPACARPRCGHPACRPDV